MLIMTQPIKIVEKKDIFSIFAYTKQNTFKNIIYYAWSFFRPKFIHYKLD
jgi:hypothetical protein